MSFREKSAWISMLSILAIYGFYFWSLFQTTAVRQMERFHSGPLLLQTIVVLVAVQIVLHVAVAIRKPREAQAPRDERERLIELKATRIGFAGLASGVVVACFLGALNPPILFSTNSLLFVLVASEVLRSAGQIVYFRLGA
jgi:hypothetical protein